jgi:hypothetical protein
MWLVVKQHGTFQHAETVRTCTHGMGWFGLFTDAAGTVLYVSHPA